MLSSSKQRRAARPWTKEEDDLLEKAFEETSEAMATRGGVDWHAIASHVPGRNNKDCRKRWVYVLGHNIRKGSWNPEEDAALRDGIRKHGTKWSLVSQVVGTRQADQCSRRWREVLNPDINHDKWNIMEDEVLRNAVRHHGCKWTEIVDRYFVGRTPISAKTRYAQLLRQHGINSSLSRGDLLCGSSEDTIRSDSSEPPSISPSPQDLLLPQRPLWQMPGPSQQQKSARDSKPMFNARPPHHPHLSSSSTWTLAPTLFSEATPAYSSSVFTPTIPSLTTITDADSTFPSDMTFTSSGETYSCFSASASASVGYNTNMHSSGPAYWCTGSANGH